MRNICLALLAVCAGSFLYSQQRDYFDGTVYDKRTEEVKTSDYYDTISKTHAIWDMTFEEWFNGPRATAGWLGAQDYLEDYGIVPVVSYLGNFAGNPTGGYRHGATNTSSVHMGFSIDVDTMTGIEALDGWSFGNSWVWRFGHSLTEKYLRNTFNVQQNFGNQTIRMQSLYLNYNKKIFSGDYDLMVKFGRIAAGDNFMTKPIYWLYQNNAMDGNPVGVFHQTEFTAYPKSVWGAFSQVTYKEGQYVKLGVYQIPTERQQSMGMHGLDWSFDCKGVNLNFEAGWDFNHDESADSPGNVSFGLISGFYSAAYNDDPSKTANYNCSIYGQFDYMIYNMGHVKRNEGRYIKRTGSDNYRDLRGLVLWGGVQANPNQDLAHMPYFINGGVLFNAPFESRGDDVLCFGIAYGKFSDSWPEEYKRGSYETVFELNYKFQINRFTFIQPNVQYILNTGCGQYSDAIVLGIQYGINL